MSDSKSSASSLRPTAPSLTSRYSKSCRVEPAHATIPAASFTHAIEPEPQYLPLGWTSRVHPEGQLYFHCDAPLKVVTEEHLYKPEILEQVLHWTQEIEHAIRRLGLPFSENLELCVILDANDQSSCLYYFVDHSTRSTFWLEPIPTTLLEISPVVSMSHLKLALEEQYWNHVEYFPTQPESFGSRAVDELISVFTHAQADCMTSEYSTFPYTSEQSARFLKLLRPHQGKLTDTHIMCLVARLWGVVAGHRFTTHYGQEHCRLSRDQTILSTPDLRQHWLSTGMSRLLFGFPANCVGKFDSLWVDRTVYVEEWRRFMCSCQEDRKLCISWAFAMMIANTITLAFSIGLRSLAFSSTCFSYASIVCGLALFIKQQSLTTATAAEAAAYLENVKHEKYGFQSIAILYSLPKAFLVWSLVSYIPQLPILAIQTLGLFTTTVVLLMFCMVSLTFHVVLSPVSIPCLSWFSRRQREKDISSAV